MKVLFILISLFFALNSYSQEHKFLPDNNLWKQDKLFRDAFFDRELMFTDIIDAGLELYAPIAEQLEETLVIKRYWADSTVNASTQRLFSKVTIKMYGGLARRPEINPEGFALVLCHELGHAYGGLPYVSSFMKLSAEGQSDYYAAKVCAKKLIDRVTTPQGCTIAGLNEMEMHGFSSSLIRGIKTSLKQIKG